jgi:RNA 3'-terminal phosphate cyclase (ATP)
LADVLILDGAHGEGGGQILRTALSLSIITGRAFRLVNIRLGRRKPGLLPQHLSAIRAAAAISDAAISGDRLRSIDLEFAPRHLARHGDYFFDVTETAEGGSAGSVTLILQTLLVPLACADGVSSLVLRGGTHVEWAPPFDHVVGSYLPALWRMGFCVDAELNRWGWYPIGDGEITCRISPGRPDKNLPRPNGLELLRRGPLRRIAGRAVAANLPAHIPQRMTDRARSVLIDFGVPANIEAQRVTAACPGAGIFLAAEYEELAASFSALGRLGKPSETVADEAVAALREHHASGAVVELHLADQLLLPLSIAAGSSLFSVARSTGHLATNAWTIDQFGVADMTIEEGTPTIVRVEPRPWRYGAPN